MRSLRSKLFCGEQGWIATTEGKCGLRIAECGIKTRPEILIFFLFIPHSAIRIHHLLLLRELAYA
jgi:hypothetical protein